MDFEFENEFRKKHKFVAGVDEAGRGCLFGPVVAASCILSDDFDANGIDDSKKLTAKMREKLFHKITKNAVSYSIAEVDVATIDKINILNGAMLAMKNSVESLKVAPSLVLIDGNKIPENLKIPAISIVKGDQKSLSIACASILAKVYRDNLIVDLAKKYPGYDLEKHKGYATKAHYERIKELGTTDLHRKSFRLF